MLDSFLNMQRDLEQDNGHSSGLVQRKHGILSVQDSPQSEWDRIAEKTTLEFGRKQTSSLPCHEPIVQRSAQKQRRWKTVDTLLCRFGYDLNCFSHNYFCKSAQSLRNSRRKCVKNTKLFMIERGNPLSEGNRVPSFVPSVIKTDSAFGL